MDSFCCTKDESLSDRCDQDQQTLLSTQKNKNLTLYHHACLTFQSTVIALFFCLT
jgi:hypothetical protein